MRFLMTWSVSVVSSARPRPWERTATDRMGRSSGLKRVMRGSLTSLRKVAFTTATFSRTSLVAWTGFTLRSNSATTTDNPS